jgi:hypothetical protein
MKDRTDCGTSSITLVLLISGDEKPPVFLNPFYLGSRLHRILYSALVRFCSKTEHEIKHVFALGHLNFNCKLYKSNPLSHPDIDGLIY